MKNYFLIFFIAILFNIVDGKIIESDTITITLDYLSQANTLVIFDIDNTLVRYATALGSDEWFSHLVDQQRSKGFGTEAATTMTLPIAYYAHFSLALVPTEPSNSLLIGHLIKNNIPFMGLTSRSLPLAERTYEQLHVIDMDFDKSAVIQTKMLFFPQHRAIYMHNILFSGNNDKGTMLLELFDALNYQPDRIIFIDDKLYNIESVEKAAQKRHISYVGIRYSRCDKHVLSFDPIKTDQELAVLQNTNRLILKNGTLAASTSP
jgi:hypothetical protein